MKADQYGTLAEQKRFSIGYRRPSEIPRSEVERAFQRCRYCRFAVARETGRGILCARIGYAVHLSGGCAIFLPAQIRPKVERP